MQEALGIQARDRVQTFRFLIEQFSLWAKNEGLPVVACHPDGPQWFSRLPEPVQVATLSHFHRYFHAAKETIDDGVSMRQDAHFLWRMFQRLGVHPASDLMDRIENGDVVEVYNSDFVQVFRNLDFFRICSYTLDDLLCRPFWELYHRDEKITAELVETLKKMFEGRAGGTLPWGKPVHTVSEIGSLTRYRAVVDLKTLSPLFDANGKVAALVSTFRIVSCVPTAMAGTDPTCGPYVGEST